MAEFQQDNQHHEKQLHPDMSRRQALSVGGALAGATLAGSAISAGPAFASIRPGEHARGQRVRARDLDVAPGVFPPGKLNAITDVAEVRVGQTTLIEGNNVRTGVTVVRPHGGNVFQQKVAGGVFIGNGFGKLIGISQVKELGTIETPITLTNTLDVGGATETVVAWTLEQSGNGDVESVNAVVGETNDGYLNDIRGQHVGSRHVRHAIENASGGSVAEGAVGAGTGTVNFGWKGGIGTSSRQLPNSAGGYTLGVLVQTNYGGLLTVAGVPIGLELGHNPFAELVDNGPETEGQEYPEGSCMIIVATDAPLSPRNLERLASRAVFGLGQTGSSYTNGSGDYAIAFSTAVRNSYGQGNARDVRLLPNPAMTPLFQMALECTQEAVYNALFMATTTNGNGHTVAALPLDKVRRLLNKYGRRSNDHSE